MRKKGDIELPELAWWLIGLLVLIIIGFFILLLSGKLNNAVEYIKNLFRLR